MVTVTTKSILCLGYQCCPSLELARPCVFRNAEVTHLGIFDVIGKQHQPVHSLFSSFDRIPNMEQLVNCLFKMSDPSLEPAVPLPAQEY